MKVKDLIANLQEFDPELPVCVADWADDSPVSYRLPRGLALGEVKLVDKGSYQEAWNSLPINGLFVCLMSGFTGEYKI